MLKAEIDALKRLTATQDVEATLGLLRQQVSRPLTLFDPYAAVVALELLIDNCRAKGDPRLGRYNTILKQTRSMTNHPALQQVFQKLVGSKDEVEVSKEIQKALKNTQASRDFPSRQWSAPRQQPYPRQQPICFFCQRPGHIARVCPNKPK